MSEWRVDAVDGNSHDACSWAAPATPVALAICRTVLHRGFAAIQDIKVASFRVRNTPLTTRSQRTAWN
jgi:hypothetical protein